MAGGRARRLRPWAAAAAVLAALPFSHAQAPLAPPLDRGAVGLGVAVRRLGVSARVLYVAAHPDDENNGALVRLARGRGVRTRLFTLTRGEGGQNEIGRELYAALGVLRTEELLAVHRPEGVEQSFGRAVDFGFSFSVDETFERWGRQDTLADVVREVRAFRPDVILTLPVEANQGGLHHQASAVLAREAFRAAADPARFPEQLRAGLRPWQAAKIYQGGVGGGPAPAGAAPVPMTTAGYDPLLGMSARELGSRARTFHRSQRVSQLYARPGDSDPPYLLVDSQPPVRWPESDILQGVDLTVAGLVRFSAGEAATPSALAEDLRRLQAELDATRAAFDARAPERLAVPLAAALLSLRRLRDDHRDEAAPDLLDRLDDEERDLVVALGLAHGLAAEAIADDPRVTPGQRVAVTTQVWNQGGQPLTVEAVTLRVPHGWSTERTDGAASPLAAGQSLRLRDVVRVSAEALPSRPYWRQAPGRDRQELEVAACEGLPFCPPDAVAVIRYRSGEATAELEVPVTWRLESAAGEKTPLLQVLPALAVRAQPAVVVVSRARVRPRTVKVTVVNNQAAAVAARVRLMAPTGWRVAPPDAPLAFTREDQALTTWFSVTPPPGATGAVDLRAVASAGGHDFTEGDEVIDYPHIEERRIYRPAVTRAIALDVSVRPGVSVGYVMGTGDEAPAALEQLGVPVTLLDEDDLAAGDLGRFGAIVLGIRAYQVRPDLRAYHGRLQRFMEEGGHVVVQYNRLDFNQPVQLRALAPAPGGQPDSAFAPFPAAASQRRVTDERSPVTVLAADAPLLTVPNRIREADWSGWVHERGTYFLDARDARYRELLSLRDPFPLNPGEQKGALVEAQVGRGTWTYVGLALFRQLPAGVPGAYRLLANLVSRPRRP